MRYIGVFNRDGGTFKTMDMEAFCTRVREVFIAHGHEIDCRVVAGANLIVELERASRECDVLLVGGGDGTVSAAAGVAFANGIPLAVLPAGTMNLFARALQIPLDLNAALEALVSGTLRQVDIATANGRPFIHQLSVGIHTKLVLMREALPYRNRIEKMLASVRAFFVVIVRPPNFRVDLHTARGVERRACSGIFVTNNPFGDGHLPHADALDAGVLGIYIAKPMKMADFVALGVSMLNGRWRDSPLVVEREVKEATLTFPQRKSSAQAVIDGELIPLERRIEVRIHPSALQVVVPATAGAQFQRVEVEAIAG